MSVFPGVLRKINRGIAKAEQLLPPKLRKSREARLWQQVAEGELAEVLLQNEGWQKLLDPWLKKKTRLNVNELVNRQRNYPDDTCLDYQRGKLKLIAELTTFLEQTVNLKPQAEQKLKLLGRSKQEEKQ